MERILHTHIWLPINDSDTCHVSRINDYCSNNHSLVLRRKSLFRRRLYQCIFVSARDVFQIKDLNFQSHPFASNKRILLLCVNSKMFVLRMENGMIIRRSFLHSQLNSNFGKNGNRNSKYLFHIISDCVYHLFIHNTFFGF